jgi:hypothetical protein
MSRTRAIPSPTKLWITSIQSGDPDNLRELETVVDDVDMDPDEELPRHPGSR